MSARRSDAGARSIEIEIDHGGKAFIRVSDDGAGMDASDAKLAFQRHATSKITAAEDLEGIGSYGFRGEALPSIAAVSRSRLITRREKDPAGTEVVVEGGSLKGVQEHACRPGTIVEVRDLFFNTPARRKFLKADSTEMGQIQDVVCRMALCAPQTRFLLKSSGKILIDLPPGAPPAQRAQAVFGPESSGQLLELDWPGEGIGFRGLLGKPSLTRGNRSQIHLFAALLVELLNAFARVVRRTVVGGSSANQAARRDVLDQSRRDVRQEAGAFGLVRAVAKEESPGQSTGEKQLLFSACHAHVTNAPLFLDFGLAAQ
jgi:DNA mismatch repair protein MutL